MKFKKNEIVRFIYRHDGGALNQGEVAWAGWALRRDASLDGLAELVNPEPAGTGRAEFAVRLHRDAEISELVDAIPPKFTSTLTRMIDPNQSYAESGTLDGDEEWRQEEINFLFAGFLFG